MLPSVVASELEQVAADAIRTAFHPTTPGFAGLIDRFLAEREQLLKGPYVSVALPFHQGTGSGKTECFLLPLLEHCRQQQAQGPDLACLIRRLRDRLQCPGEELVCVGTSATLGGPDSREAMCSYAGQIFASSFEPASLIEEERLSPEAFFRDH